MKNNDIKQGELEGSKEAAVQYMKALTEVARESFLILDADLRVVLANPTFYQNFQVTPEKTENILLYDLGNGQWNIPALKSLLEEILPEKKVVKDYEVKHTFQTIGEKTIVLNARRIDTSQLIILAMEDITVRKDLEEKLAEYTKGLEVKVAERTAKLETSIVSLGEAKAEDEAILASIGDGLVVVDKEGKILRVNYAFENLVGWKEKEVLGKLLVEVIPREDEAGNIVPFNERVLTKILSTTTTTTWYYIRKDKTRFPAASIITPFIVEGKIVGAVEVFRDITKEKEVDKAKSEFVSLASHQLRTPLGIMKWYLEVLQKEDYLQKAPQQTKEYFDEVSKSNERVLSLVRDLLSVSRIEQGRVKNVPKLVNIPEIITDIVTQMQILAKSKKVTLQLELKAQKLPNMYLDPLRFHEVIENLVTNAIEYTPTMGKIEVTVDENNNTVTVSVQDTGMGISAEDKSKLFDKFFRSQGAIKNNPEGSGLGLYVVKSYVEEWGGKISVESVEGKGSTFSILLPIKGANQKDRGN